MEAGAATRSSRNLVNLGFARNAADASFEPQATQGSTHPCSSRPRPIHTKSNRILRKLVRQFGSLDGGHHFLELQKGPERSALGDAQLRIPTPRGPGARLVCETSRRSAPFPNGQPNVAYATSDCPLLLSPSTEEWLHLLAQAHAQAQGAGAAPVAPRSIQRRPARPYLPLLEAMLRDASDEGLASELSEVMANIRRGR